VAKAQNLTLWSASSSLVVSDTASVTVVVAAARQLRQRERDQIAANIQAGHHEVAASFIWHKTMALLKKQLGTLGNQFISELLQRPDIDEDSEIQSSISDSEALSLAKDLGMITPTQAMRLAHSQEVINHFASIDAVEDMDDGVGMTPEETISCLRVCVQGVLGQESVKVAEDFAVFRSKLESQTFTADSPEVLRLKDSPYFFVRTAISILISVLKTRKGAQLEHASRNAIVIIPAFWENLKQPERWQIGQAYASEFNEGRKATVQALHAVLLAVKGFDYVPENLRSNTFTRVANSLIAAHQAMNNFYNEPAPTRELASLGTSIPGPAVAICMTAILCVKLGNMYGVSNAAQSAADQLLSGISKDRWLYYINGRLEFDRIILPKLTYDRPVDRWIDLIAAVSLTSGEILSKPVRDLISATKEKKKDRIVRLARSMLAKAFE
jgi:hypothetical protein